MKRKVTESSKSNSIIPSNEAGRLKALKRYQILDTPPDGSFDRIVSIASRVFNMPIALVTLVDKDRIWFKAKSGLDGVAQINRDPGLCASAILSDDIYLVENAKEDVRTLANPLVCSEFGLQFYAAVPLKTRDGYNIGTLCLIDKKPRFLSSEQMLLLQDFGNIVVDEMELRLSALNHCQKYIREKEIVRELKSQTSLQSRASA
jgi:GAF domain-containing protein